MKIIFRFCKIAFLSSMFFISSAVHAQQMPAFSILQSNGKTLNTAKLPHTKPVVLIYFAPDCDHCTKLLSAMFGKMSQFNRATILLVSFKPMNEITDFEKKYKTAAYKNMIVGIEQPLYFLQRLYQLQSTPYTALFDKSGKLIVDYKTETPLNELIAQLKRTK
ncbi:MAG: redoxin domain-containing protein [Ginsengibacter sp.]